MQPYLFPYLGYFDLINYTDRWVVFDLAQYVKQRWMNRNRILHPNQGWQYIGVPVRKAPLSTPIRLIQIQNEIDWKARIYNQIDHYRTKAPYFKQVRLLLEKSLEPSFTKLSELNVHTLSVICSYVGIDCRFELVSELGLAMHEIKKPHDWVFQLCELTGAEEYANLPGGTSIYYRSLFDQRGLKLTFRNLAPMKYDCTGYQYEPGLSILDVLMWNSPQEVCDFLNSN